MIIIRIQSDKSDITYTFRLIFFSNIFYMFFREILNNNDIYEFVFFFIYLKDQSSIFYDFFQYYAKREVYDARANSKMMRLTGVSLKEMFI